MNNKLETVSNLFVGNEIRSIWDSEKEEKPKSLRKNIRVAKRGGK